MSTFLRTDSWRFGEVQLIKMPVSFIKILSSPTSATSHWIYNISDRKYSLCHKVIHIFHQWFIQLFNNNKITNVVLQIRVSSPQLFFLVEILQHNSNQTVIINASSQY